MSPNDPNSTQIKLNQSKWAQMKQPAQEHCRKTKLQPF